MPRLVFSAIVFVLIADFTSSIRSCQNLLGEHELRCELTTQLSRIKNAAATYDNLEWWKDESTSLNWRKASSSGFGGIPDSSTMLMGFKVNEMKQIPIFPIHVYVH